MIATQAICANVCQRNRRRVDAEQHHAGLTQPIGGPDAPPVADGGKQLFVNRHP
jgi:hypothetical protein